MIPATSCANGAAHVSGAHAQAKQAAPIARSLLPEPSTSSGAGMEDGLLQVYALLDQQSKVQSRTAKIGVETKRQQEHADVQKDLEAIKKQQEAEKEEHGFWSDLKHIAGTVGKIASVVAGAAAIVCSGGAAAPLILGIAAVALSAGGAIVKETHCFGKASDAIGLGMEIGGAVCGGAGGIASASGAAASAGSAATETADTASAATSAAATASTSTQATFAVVKGSATAVAGAATATEGVADIKLAGFESDRLQGAADQEDVQVKLKALRKQEQMELDWMKIIQETKNDAQGSVMDAINSIHQARLVAATGVRA
jgi:hypothetical protein